MNGKFRIWYFSINFSSKFPGISFIHEIVKLLCHCNICVWFVIRNNVVNCTIALTNFLLEYIDFNVFLPRNRSGEMPIKNSWNSVYTMYFSLLARGPYSQPHSTAVPFACKRFIITSASYWLTWQSFLFQFYFYIRVNVFQRVAGWL